MYGKLSHDVGAMALDCLQAEGEALADMTAAVSLFDTGSAVRNLYYLLLFRTVGRLVWLAGPAR